MICNTGIRIAIPAASASASASVDVGVDVAATNVILVPAPQRNAQGIHIAATERFDAVVVRGGTVDGSDGVDYGARIAAAAAAAAAAAVVVRTSRRGGGGGRRGRVSGKIKGRCDSGGAGGTAVEGATVVEKGWAGGAVDGAVDAAAAEEGVCWVLENGYIF